VKLKCMECDFVFESRRIHDPECPKCGSTDVELAPLPRVLLPDSEEDSYLYGDVL